MNGSVAMFVRNDMRNDARVLKEARALRDAGWRVRLVGVRSPETAAQETADGIEFVRVEPFAGFGIVRRFRRGAGNPFPPGAGSAGPAAVSAAPAPRPRLRALAAGAAYFVRDEWAEADFADKAARAAGAATVYHAHDLNAFAAAERAQAAHGGALVLDHHEFFSERNFYRRPGPLARAWLRRKERRAARAADLNITVSHGIADELQSRYGLAGRPLVVMNSPEALPGIAAGPSLRDRIGAAGPVVLYLGAVTFNRGIETVIAALPALPDVHFALLGPEQRGYRASLERTAAGAGVAGRVHFLGAVAPGDVVATAAGASASVVLIQNVCLSYYYCSPNKLFESLAAGIPVVASDFPDLRRVLAGRDAGELCDPANVPAVTAALRKVLAYDRVAVSARARALAGEYTWQRERETLVAAYEKFRKASLPI